MSVNRTVELARDNSRLRGQVTDFNYCHNVCALLVTVMWREDCLGVSTTFQPRKNLFFLKKKKKGGQAEILNNFVDAACPLQKYEEELAQKIYKHTTN